MRVDVYSRFDAYVGTIATDELLSFVHTDELNGEDSVSIKTTFHLREGYRLVWQDPQGTCHEHVCQDPKGAHEKGKTTYTDTALNSVCELFGDYIEDKRPYGYSYLKALEVALEPTRWVAGTVDQLGTVASGQTFYHEPCRAALNGILENGGELETAITVGTSGVSSRKVGIRQHRGSTSGHRRFVYGKDVTGISKTEHWGAITACYGYGKGVETDSGGYGRKLTFGDVNGGLNYVADAEALEAYGRPDGGGGYAHVYGVYENSDCEDAEQLLSETTAYLDEHKVPGVTYKADVLDLVQFGRSWEGVAVGDDVQVIDREYDPELRLEGRVTKLVRNCLNGAMEVTLGNVTETMADMWIAQQQAVASLSKRSSSWDVAASTPAAYLQQLMDAMNERFNTLGMSYRFDSFEKGTIWSSVPLDEEGNPTKTGGWAMQACSLGFRIASGTKADGSWDWTTFGTGEGFTADAIVTGTLLADLITAGVLRVQKDGVTVFEADFESGNVTISGAVGAANTTLGAMAVACDVEYGNSTSSSVAPTTWTTNASWKQGYYLWTRTKMTLADGSTAYGDARLVSNSKGIGAAQVREQYYLSTSKTAQSGGSWAYAQQAWVKGRYYWTRSEITWSDGTVTYTTAVLASALTSGNQSTDDLDDELDQTEVFNRLTNNGATQGIYMQGGKLYLNGTYLNAGKITVAKDGSTVFSADFDTGDVTISGAVGAGSSTVGSMVTKVETRYGTSANASTEPTNWTSNAVWSSSLPCMWTRNKETHADGTVSYTTARRITSANGLGGVSTVPQWYLSTSSTAQEGGSWLSYMPAWTSGRYYWTRNKTTWSDGSVTYDTAVLARALTSANQSVDDLDDDLDQEGVFNRLTNNSANQGVYLSDGKVYINASYIKTGTMQAGVITDAQGYSKWDLTNSTFTTNYMTAKNITANGSFTCGTDTSYKATLTGGCLNFYYNNNQTIQLVSIPSYTSGAKGGYLQTCSGATYLGLRAPHLYTAVDTTAAGTIGYTGTQKCSYYSLNSEGYVGSHYRYLLKFINGICVGATDWAD